MSSNYKIVTRPGTRNLSVRYYVPRTYQNALGIAGDITKSLGTPDRRKANEVAPSVVAKIVKELQDKYQAKQNPPACLVEDAAEVEVQEPSHDALEEAARLVYEMQVQADLEERADPEYAKQLSISAKDWSKELKAEAKWLRKVQAGGDYSVADLETWSDHFNFTFRSGSPYEQRFRQVIAWAFAEATERWSEHAAGKIGGSPRNPFFKRPKGPVVTSTIETGPIAAKEPKKPPLMDFWDDHLKQLGDGVKVDTLNGRRSAVEMFAEFVGHSKPVNEITKQDAIQWIKMLYDLPTKSAQRKVFAGMTSMEIVEKNASLQLPVLSKTTIRKHITGVSVYFSWLNKLDYIPANIWEGLAPVVQKGESKRAPFTIQHLQKLFNSPLFTGCLGTREIRSYTTAGTMLINNWYFWLPLLAAFSGARMGELAQLETNDIQRQDGVWFMLITNEGFDPDKSVKTKLASRTVPIHSVLIDLGFLKLVSSMPDASRVFPDLPRDSRKQFGIASKFFRKYLGHMDFEPDHNGKTPCFHSFRHSVIDELRRNNSEATFQPLIGHAPASTTRGYGKAETLSVSKRKDLIEEIRYPDLDISSLLAIGNRLECPVSERVEEF